MELLSLCHSPEIEDHVVYIIRRLIPVCGNMDDIRDDEDGATPLHWAAHHNSSQIVQALAKAGASVNITDKKGRSPTWKASRDGNEEIIKLLLELKCDIHQAAEGGITAIHVASENGHQRIVELLIGRGAKIDQTSERGFTPVYLASKNGHDDIIRFLADRSVNISEASDEGFTPIHIAAKNGHYSTVQVLVKLGGDIRQAATGGVTPLHAAVKGAHHEVAQCLVDAGADLTATDEKGETCVAYARRYIKDEQARQKMLALLDPVLPPLSPPATNKQLQRDNDCFRWMMEKNMDIFASITDQDKGRNSDYNFCPMRPVEGDEVRRVLKQVEKNSVHKMSSVPRGRAIILNNMNFDGKPERQRHGSNVDAHQLTLLFRQLGFQVIRWNDLSSKKLSAMIEDEKKSAQHKKSDAFVMVAMSHGGAGRSFEMTDGEMIDMEKDLVTPFDGENWPVMAGKPKVFLFQCCRGKGGSYPVLPSQAADSPSKLVTTPYHAHHPKAHIIKIFSTYDDESATRDEIRGSWFIREFILATEAHSHLEHLRDIVSKANLLLQHRENYCYGHAQVAQEESSLLKKLYFLPGFSQ